MPNSPQQSVVVREARRTDARAVLDLLMAEEHLEVAFDHHEFKVVEIDGRVVGAGRLRSIGDGLHEIASVVVAKDQRKGGLATRLVTAILEQASGPVYALALAPGFFERVGFRAVEKTTLPSFLLAKADGMCRSSGFVPMRRGNGP